MRILCFLTLFVIYSCVGVSSTEEINSNRVSEYADDFLDKIILPNFCKEECKAEDFETQEYNGRGQKFLDAINAADAYAYLANQGKNWAGNDVKVAVVDTGVDLHNDLQDNILKSDSSRDSFDDSFINVFGFKKNHGTHVAGIIAASKNDQFMHGVAPKAKIIAIKWKSLGGVNSGIHNYDDHVINTKASVVNGSFGSPGNNAADFEMIENLVNNGVHNLVQVYSAGNDRILDPNLGKNPKFPAYHSDNERMKGELLAVEAFDLASGNLAYFSNKCGIIKRCLAAPGMTIYSTIPGIDKYDYYSGTSMAAPVVSGAVAVLQSAWPNLNGKEIVDILLETTTPINKTVNLLNLEKAVKPVGQREIITSNQLVAIAYDKTKLLIPSSFSNVFKEEKLQSFLSQAVFFDSFKRDYKANYNDKISFYGANNKLRDLIIKNNAAENVNLGFSDLKLNFSHKKNKIDNYLFLTAENKKNDLALENISFFKNYKKLNFSFVKSNNYEINDSTAKFAHKFNLLSQENFNGYFTKITDDLLKFAVDYKFNLNSNFKLEFAKANINNEIGDVAIVNSSYKKIFKNLSLDLSHQLIKEENSMLGIAGIAGFSTVDNSKTNGISLALEYDWGKNKFLSKYAFSDIKYNNQSNSLLKLSENLRTSNFIFSYIRDMSKFDMGFAFSTPMQIEKGSMKFTMPTGYDLEGNIEFAEYNMDLTSYKKYDYEIFFVKENDNSKLNFNLNLEQQKFSNRSKYEVEALIAFSKFF